MEPWRFGRGWSEPELRAFLDESLLGGKTPDKFDDVAGFKQLIAQYEAFHKWAASYGGSTK